MRKADLMSVFARKHPAPNELIFFNHVIYTTTIPLFVLYLITYIKEREKIYIYLYLIRPGAEIILRFSSQFSRI